MRFTIGHRLNLGFGIITALTLFVGAAAFWQSQETLRSSGAQAEYAADLGVASRTKAQALLMRMSGKNFLISNDPADKADFTARVSELRATLVEAEAAMQNPTRLEHVQTVERLLGEYESAFAGAERAILARNAALARKSEIGSEVVDTLDTLRDRLESQDLDRADRLISDAAEAVLRSRLNTYVFIRTGEESAAESATSETAAAIAFLTDAKAASLPANERDAVDGVIALLQEYDGLTAEIRSQIESRDNLVSNTLDRIGPEMASRMSDVSTSLIDDNGIAAERAASSIGASRLVIGLVVVVGLVVAGVVSVVIGRSITKPLTMLRDNARVIASGDYTKTITWSAKDETGELASCFNDLVRSNREAIAGIADSTGEVKRHAENFTSNSGSLTGGLSRQKQETTQVASAVEEMACSIREVAQKSASVTEAARRSGEQATAGGDVVKNTIEEINGIASEVAQSRDAIMTLGEKGQKIGEIISVINDIADQTNLLALNAAIEAARAGEHGRGFAVVADEVRKLAERTTEATEDVSRSIRDIQSETDAAVKLIELSNERAGRGVELAQEAGDALGRIVADSGDLVNLIETIAVAAEQQSAVSADVARSVDGIRQVSEEITGTAEHSSAGAQQLALAADNLAGYVSRFKI